MPASEPDCVSTSSYMKRNFTFLLIVAILAAAGCQKKVDLFVPDEVQTSPDLTWYTTIQSSMPIVQLRNDLRPVVQVDSFVYNPAGLVYNTGLMGISLPPASLVKSNGSNPSGYVRRDANVLRKKGEWISAGISTEADNRLLISGGVVSMNLNNTGSELFINAGQNIKIRYNVNQTQPGMQLYNGFQVNHGYAFQLNADPAMNYVSTIGGGYELTTTKVKLLQSAYLFDTIGIPQTKLRVSLPSHYTNANTQVFISFNDMACVHELRPDIALKNFVSGDLPVNRPVTIVVLSKQAGDYYMESRQTVITLPSSGMGTSDVLMTPVKKTLAQVKAELDLL